jgi:hypothetical protein
LVRFPNPHEKQAIEPEKYFLPREPAVVNGDRLPVDVPDSLRNEENLMVHEITRINSAAKSFNILIMPLPIGSEFLRRLLADIGENTAVNIEDMSVDEI